MKKSFLVVVKVVVLAFGIAALALSQRAMAQYSDTIGFDGVATFNGPLESGLSGATGFTTIYGITGPCSGPQVIYGSTSGTYSAIPAGTSAVFNSFSFSPLSFSTAPITLWTLTDAGTTYSFDITSVTYLSETNGFLNISGDGIAYVNGTAYTDAAWAITDTGGGFAATFGDGTTASPVPEPSSSLILLAGFAAVLIHRLHRFSQIFAQANGARLCVRSTSPKAFGAARRME